MPTIMRPHRPRTNSNSELLTHSHTLNGAIIDGIDGRVVEVQARAVELLAAPKPWTKCVTVAGLPRSQAADMLTRIGGAIAALGFPLSPVRIVLNFHPSPDSPAPQLDLPAALVLMQAAGYLASFDIQGEYLIFGALDIHGEVRHTPAALPLCCAARNGQAIVCPEANAAQCRLARVVRQCRLFPASSLESVAKMLGGVELLPEMRGGQVAMQPVQKTPPDFGDIAGLRKAKRAATIAAAGGHAILLMGPPGAGKSLTANAIAGILPPLSNSEKVELTRIWSAAGMLDNDQQAVVRRPFRVVHHTATKQAVVGGGSETIQPGEVTLAHLGVLFLDELTEFRSDTLEALRQPLEDGCVRISRVHSKAELPCRFSLVAACNPCPCGFYGCDETSGMSCTCTDAEVARYQAKISGPLLDRIDLVVDVQPVPIAERLQTGNETTEQIRKRVVKAMERQRARLARTSYKSNADIPGPHVFELCNFSPEALAEWRQACEAGKLSQRKADRCAKVARTIADLADSDRVGADHVREAVQYV